ncbi:MAG TPA: dolichyl-phosphate beta-glucosyltransferase [Candidatus Binatia bacterium]|nr:dolichyl-phosphate beta-glucosyltransferase [Candidatus Binatia bacterium]
MLTTEIVIPVYNEERDLDGSIRKLVAFARSVGSFESTITIADNGSTDGTRAVAERLAAEYPEVRVVHLAERGRGGALKAVWSQSRADVVSYMDVDLSTNLAFFPLLIAGISIGYDVAIGSRLLQASQTRRSLRREVLSRVYNLLVKVMFFNRFSDAQCGFKAVRRDVALELLPLVENTSWFFDTELLLLAEQHGYRVFEVPVEWIEDLDSRVRIVRTVLEDLRGLVRLRFRRRRKQLARAVSPS